MTESMNLVTAQISFLDTHLSLIHIPIELYSAFLQPILRLLFGEDYEENVNSIPWTNQHDFLNVTITSIEVSVICSRTHANRLFRPLLEHYKGLLKRGIEVEISYEEYVVVQVDGQGLDAGQRVLELTSPLAMAGIPLFFITTYFSDYILVPSRARATVTGALQQRGFVFSPSADAFVSQLSPQSPTAQERPYSARSAQSSPSSSGSMPSTPPAKDVPELQTRTFTKLRKHNINPIVSDSIRVISCAGNREPDSISDERLKSDLLQVLLATTSVTLSSGSAASNGNGVSSRRGLGLGRLSFNDTTTPDCSTRFLSITITSTEPISIFLEQRLLDRLGSSLLGAKEEEDCLVPISFDLRRLSMDATGVVCGVAGRLAQSDTSKELDYRKAGSENGAMDITFLSTAKAGNVLVRASALNEAMESLDRGMRELGMEKHKG